MINITLPPEQVRTILLSLLYVMDNGEVQTWNEWFLVNDAYRSVWQHAPPEIQDEMERKVREF